MKTLLLGAGRRRERIVADFAAMTVEIKPFAGEVVTLDVNTDHKPDIVHDLNIRPLPFADNEFDEIHAYEVLEHVGRQGDYKSFFEEFCEYWRILKPGGLLVGTCPHYMNVWAWADPSHTRVLPVETFVFLSQDQYAKQVGISPMSDFRYLYKADFNTKMTMMIGGVQAFFVLEAVKPSRISK